MGRKENEMKKKARLMALIAAGLFAAAAMSAAQPAQAEASKAGYELLDRLVTLLVKAAAPGSGSGDIGQEIVLLAKEAKAAQGAKRVDDLFTVRFSRLLSAVRQALLMDP